MVTKELDKTAPLNRHLIERLVRQIGEDDLPVQSGTFHCVAQCVSEKGVGAVVLIKVSGRLFGGD